MSHFKQVEAILQVVVPQLAAQQGKKFDRQIVVTTDIEDFSVSNGTVRVHPASATANKNPIPFCNRIIRLCEEYDLRMAKARAEHILELQTGIDKWYRQARRAFGPVEARRMMLEAQLRGEKYLPGGDE